MVIIIPLTSSINALRFTNTLEIKKSEFNGLEKDSIALIFHIQALDKKRFMRKIGVLEDDYVSQIEIMLRDLFKI